MFYTVKNISKLQNIFIIALIFLFTFGVYTNVNTESSVFLQLQHFDLEQVIYPDPVSFDFKEIKKRGTIRMITRYNSSSYFLHRGIDRGFEYELVSRFAKENGLKVEVILIRPGEDPIEMLNRGEGDLIAENYAVTQNRLQHVIFSKPYNIVNQVLVHGDTRNTINDVSMLEEITITVSKNSSSYEALLAFEKQGYNIRIDVVGEDLDTEVLIPEVADGRIDATIAEDNHFRVTSHFINGITSGMAVSESDKIAWAVRKNAPELKQKMDEFMHKHFRIRETDETIYRSEFLNVLSRRYFEDNRQVSRFRDRDYDTLYSGYLSPYDDMVKTIAEEAGLDWKLVVAIMAQESAFNPNAESWAGALGLMQIIPRFSLVESEELLYIPEINIREGVRYLEKHLKREAHLDSLNRYSFALAAYNVGMGHLSDARRLAVRLGKDPNEWNNIADALLKLMDYEYYQHARYGYKRGIETVNYVQSVMNRYNRYHNIFELAAQFDEQRITGYAEMSR